MQKNQKILLAIIGLVLMISGVVGYLAFKKEKEAPKIKENKFKEEYEKLNGVVNDKGYTYPTVDIDVNSNIKYVNESEVLEILDNEGVIYFGTATSFECRNIITSLIKAADSVSLDKLYYFDVKNVDENYIKILDKIDEVLKKEEATNELGEKVATVSRKLIIPTIIIVQDGEIVDYHVGGIEKENQTEELTKEEKEELFTIYTSKLIKASSTSCNEHTKC